MNIHDHSADNSLEDIFGPPISVYTRAEAIDDGVLVDLNQFEVCREHYREPIACTTTVWEIVQKAVANPSHHNDIVGVIHDVLWMSRVCRRSSSTDHWLFQVRITGAGRKSLFTFKMVYGPGDDGQPVLTLMLPDED